MNEALTMIMTKAHSSFKLNPIDRNEDVVDAISTRIIHRLTHIHQL